MSHPLTPSRAADTCTQTDFPPVFKMITLDEASGDIVLTHYFIVRRVFDL